MGVLIEGFFYSSPCVSFYSICTSDNRMVLEELDPTLDTSCYKELWDISFDLEHRFWLLEASENQTVHVFRCTKDSNKLQVAIYAAKNLIKVKDYKNPS